MTKIEIVSGEGAGEGHIEPHTGKPTARAVLARLAKERCGGDRWAWARIDGERVEDHALEQALLAPRPRSGKRRNPLITLVSTPDEIELWDRAAEHADGSTRSDWARNVLTVAAADELGMDPLETLRGLGRDES